MNIKPWDEKSKKILDQLARDGKAFTTDITFSRTFGRMYHELEDMNLIDIARVDRKKKTWFVIPPDVRLVPIQRKQYRFYRL